MAADDRRAVWSRAPHDVGRTANDFGVRVYTAGGTHRADPVPDSWKGQRIAVHAVGGALDVAFSTSPTAEVDTSVSATDAGATAKAGRTIASGATEYFVLPNPDNQTLYFVREGAATSARLHLASAK